MRLEIRSGLNGSVLPWGRLNAVHRNIDVACDQFGSYYVLRMGDHYQRYVISGRLPSYNMLHAIYSSALPPSLTLKKRAPSIVGNIGESMLGLLAQRKLGATGVSDILPLATQSGKTPDFLVRVRPHPSSTFLNVSGLVSTRPVFYWPAESKAASSKAYADSAAQRALQQLGNYWFEVASIEPTIVGYGLICCFVYRGAAKHSPFARLYVITPSNQTALIQRINAFAAMPVGCSGFLAELATPNSTARRNLRNV